MPELIRLLKANLPVHKRLAKLFSMLLLDISWRIVYIFACDEAHKIFLKENFRRWCMT